MNDDAVVQRLNLIIGLLVVVIAILLWPILPKLLFITGLVLFAVVAGLMIWGMTQTYR
ncbi:hypothetical protein [Halopiger aswanensis]|nr:hypothetical protein [Halopiger aswanensis]